MSAPRYTITLQAGGERIARRLRTVVGDHAGLEAELRLMLESGELVDLSRSLESRRVDPPGLRASWQAWIAEHGDFWEERDPGRGGILASPAPGHGFCDGCGAQVPTSDLEPVINSNLAGVVLCQACKKH